MKGLPHQGQLCRRRADGKRYEVVWVTQRSVPPMVQLRREGAANLKNTIWTQLENFVYLYELVDQ